MSTPSYRPRWPDLPIALAALLLLAGGVLLMAQILLGAVAHGKQMKLCAAVFGVARPPVAALTLENVLTGRYQKALELNIGTREPYFPLAVRVRNQVEYSLFGVSATPSVVVGNHLQLIETTYIQDYCSRNVARFMAGAPAWAAKIRQMQDMVQARGQVFLYVLTPSKVAQYPGTLPPALPCPSSAADRAGVVPAWLAVLQKAGVHVDDTTAALRAARAQYPAPLFPRGGTHWDALGAALGAQSIEAALHTQTGDAQFAPFTFTWQRSDQPEKTDVDLTFLMNLIWPPVHFEVPLVMLHEAPKAADCRPLRIVIVGGSFMEHVGAPLSQLPCGARVAEYFYWWMHRDLWIDGKNTLVPVSPALRDAELRAADVVIYEENEAILGRSLHGPLFYRWLLKQRVP